MTLVATTRAGIGSGPPHGTGTLVTASFTPSNASLLVVIGGFQRTNYTGDSSAAMTITDSAGLTWTSQALIGSTIAYGCNMRVWTAPVTTGVSMTVTLDCGANDATSFFASVADFTDYDTGTPIGVTGTDAALVSNGADSVTLSGATAATSIVFGGRCGGPSGIGTMAATPDTGHVEVHDLNIEENGGLQTQTRTAGSTSTAFSWADVASSTAVLDNSNVGLAIEIMQAGGAPIPSGAVTGTVDFAGSATGVNGNLPDPIAATVHRTALRHRY